jgi:hypothetical protein
MGRIRAAGLATAALVIAAAAGAAACGAGQGARDTPVSATPCPTPPAVDPTTFVHGVDNRYFPLKPGTTWRYRGRDGGDPILDIVSVSNQTKRILGVDTTVVRDRAYVNGELQEDTQDWFAQDKDGTIWYFGEKTREHEDGRLSTEGSWQAGVNDARAGIFMPRRPRVGQVFHQEFARGVGEDCFQVIGLETAIRVPYGSSQHALRTKEFNRLEPGVVDNKWYVPGVGQVREQTVRGGSDFLQLVSVERP